jgi:hypothetical protein
MFTERIWKDCVTAPVPSLHCADQLLGVVCSWSISSIGWRAPCSRINFDIFPYTITCQAQAHSILDKDECSTKARIATRNSWLCSSGFNQRVSPPNQPVARNTIPWPWPRRIRTSRASESNASPVHRPLPENPGPLRRLRDLSYWCVSESGWKSNIKLVAV